MRKPFLLLMLIVFLGICIAFGFVIIETMNPAFSIPCIVGLTGVILIIVLICKGHKEYYVCDGKLIMKRDNKEMFCLSPTDIRLVKFIFDFFDDTLHMICYEYKDRKYYIVITDQNKKEFVAFFDDLKKSRTNNLLYYLIEAFIV